MTAFISMLKTAMRQRLQYRAAALAGVFTQLVFGVIYIMVYQAFFASGSRDMGMTIAQTVSYVWIGQATYRMMAWSGDTEIEAMMRDGRIAFELARPVDLFSMWFARSVAIRTAPLLTNTPILVLLTMLVFPRDMRLTFEISMLPMGIFSLLLAMLVSAAMTTILTATYFWTISGQGINRILPMIGSLCAGHILPLQFFPAGVRTFLRMLPFASMLDAPLRILIGAASLTEGWTAIALQAVWLVVLIGIGRALLKCGVRKCMVQGG